MHELLSSLLIAFGLSLLTTWILSRPMMRDYFQDIPNRRSSHDRTVSRGGGIAIISGSLTGIACFSLGWNSLPITVLVGAALLMLVSIIDDRGHIDWRTRGLIHLVAAGCLVWGQGSDAVLHGLIASIGTVIAIVWFINLYNFMDGSDGLAGVMALVGYSTISLLGLLSGQTDISAVSLVLAGAVAGFLILNLPPAKIFMGDTGATFLGFSLAGLVLWSIRDGVLSIGAVLLLFSPFWVDASFTLAKRIFRGERVWEGHKQHYYQRLLVAGFSHRKVLGYEFGLMLACAVMALIFQLFNDFSVKLGVIGMWAVLILLAMAWVRRIEEGIR